MLNQTSRRTTLNWEDEQKGAGAGKGAGQGQGRPDPSRPNLSYKLDVDYNLAAFNSAIANIDRERVRQKRKVYNFLYTEAIMSMEPIPGTEPRKRRSRFFPWRSLGRQAGASAAAGAGGAASGAGPGPEAGDYEMGGLGEDDTPEEGLKGVSFQKMLMILAHYKLIEDDQCLSIRDMFHHRQKMDRIHAHMNVIMIRSVLLKFLIRQRFLKHYRAVQRIQAMMGGASWSDDQPPIGGSPSSGPSLSSSTTPLASRSAPMASSSSPAGAVVGSSQHTASMAQVPEAYSSVSSTGRSPSSHKQVRINVDDSVQDTRSSSTVAFSDSNVGGPGSSLSLKSVIEEDPIEPVQAGAMIDDLRSEWRSKFSCHSFLPWLTISTARVVFS